MNKNLLSENMLRFGTKNLTESQRRQLQQLLTEAETPANLKLIKSFFASLIKNDKREGAMATAEAIYFTEASENNNPHSYTACFVHTIKAKQVSFYGDSEISNFPMIMFCNANDWGKYDNISGLSLPDEAFKFSAFGSTNLKGGAGGFTGAKAVADVIDTVSRYSNIPKDVYAKHLQLNTGLSAAKTAIKAHQLWPKVKAALVKYGGARCQSIAEFIG